MKTFFVLLVVGAALTLRARAVVNERIVGGSPVDRKYRIHIARLLVTNNQGGQSICTGTILARKYILSAAHCFDKTGRVKDVNVTGSYANIGTLDAEPATKITNYTFNKVFIHKKYKPYNKDYSYDIAVVELKRKIVSRLYNPVQIGTAPGAGTEVIAVGYGVLDEAGNNATFSMQASMTAQDFSTCYDTEGPNFQKFLSESRQVCATSVGFPDVGSSDVCDGDDGGPLFRKVGGGKKPRQYGIISFSSSKCGAVGATPWFTRVSHFKNSLATLVDEGESGSFNVKV